MPVRIPDDQRAAIIADITANQKSRNQIARDHQVAASTVGKIAKDAGLTGSFDRAQTEKATRARATDLAACRANLQSRLLALAAAGIEQAETMLDDATSVQAMTIAGIALDKHLALVKHDAAQGADAGRSLLGDLGRALGIAAEQLSET